MLWRVEYPQATYRWSRTRPAVPDGFKVRLVNETYVLAVRGEDRFVALMTSGVQADPLRLINCTPHTVTIITRRFDEDSWVMTEDVLTVPPSGMVARVELTREKIGSLSVTEEESVPIYATATGPVAGLPPVQAGRYVIVSRAVAEACRDRGDLLIVDDTVRDEDGTIIAARALASLATDEAREAFRRLAWGGGEYLLADE